jgi:hypothetical protein
LDGEFVVIQGVLRRLDLLHQLFGLPRILLHLLRILLQQFRERCGIEDETADAQDLGFERHEECDRRDTRRSQESFVLNNVFLHLNNASTCREIKPRNQSPMATVARAKP